VTRDIEHVVDAAGDREAAGLRIADRAVAGKVVAARATLMCINRRAAPGV
jgi:hypothetical protein